MLLKNSYDVIVVGAGPAGSMAALWAAKNGVSVLLVEKDREIGVPVRCAEAVGKEDFEKVLEGSIDERWIAARINRFQFVAPDGTSIYPQVNVTGYVLHRKLFDFDLAQRAAHCGAKVITKTYVSGLVSKNGTVKGVICNYKGKSFQIRTKVVIGADGVESRVGRWAGITKTIKMRDMETCSQVTLTNTKIPEDLCTFYFSQKKFPGGYAWAFPKGNGSVNVGLGISAEFARKKVADECLDEFLKNHFPHASILYKTVGGVPCADRLEKFSTAGLVLIGDAASQANPMTGGGITRAMIAGKIAGKIIAEKVKNNKVSAKSLKAYDREWNKVAGKTQRKHYKIKETIKLLSDENLNSTAQILKKIPPKEHTLLKIFQTALRKKPSLALDILKVLSPFS
jgi:digeranylgeranylglycerophospholipid reductase